jgi:hypothetical protein
MMRLTQRFATGKERYNEGYINGVSTNDRACLNACLGTSNVRECDEWLAPRRPPRAPTALFLPNSILTRTVLPVLPALPAGLPSFV